MAVAGKQAGLWANLFPIRAALLSGSPRGSQKSRRVLPLDIDTKDEQTSPNATTKFLPLPFKMVANRSLIGKTSCSCCMLTGLVCCIVV